jgi:hypothetical protein
MKERAKACAEADTLLSATKRKTQGRYETAREVSCVNSTWKSRLVLVSIIDPWYPVHPQLELEKSSQQTKVITKSRKIITEVTATVRFHFIEYMDGWMDIKNRVATVQIRDRCS